MASHIPTRQVFAPEQMEEFGRAVIELISGEAERRRTSEDSATDRVEFEIDVEVRYYTSGSAARPAEPCCVCYHAGDSGRICAGECC